MVVLQKSKYVLIIFVNINKLDIHRKIMSPENQKVFSKMCRLCISQPAVLVNIFPKCDIELERSSNNFVDIIERLTTIKISPIDSLPQQICDECIKVLNSMLHFQNKCMHSDKELHKMTQILNDTDNKPKIKIEAIDDIQENVPDVGAENFKSELDFSSDNDFSFRYENTTRTYGSKTDDINSLEPNSVNDTENQPKIRGWRPQKVACHICGKLFEAFKLQFHINIHYGLKPYECKETNCISKFAAPHQLNRHKKLCHTTEATLFCDVCGKGFKIKSNLKMDRSYHFDPELPCKVCKKLLRNSRALKKHMLVHSQERKFPCDSCDKSFQTNYTLRIHKRVHTQEKPFSCSSCGTAIAYKCLLKTHAEKCHKQTT